MINTQNTNEVDMDVNKCKEIYNYLSKLYSEYLFASTKGKREVEKRVRYYAQNMDDSIYIEINDGNASGLFEPGFFESDMQKALRLLKTYIKAAK